MPLALYTIKDSGLSAIFVIFICSLWPMLVNRAFGVSGVRKEWLNVARTLEVGRWRRAFTVILPLSITNVIIAFLLIGVVGMLLDQLLARAARAVTFPE